jgi:hypothetical protein
MDIGETIIGKVLAFTHSEEAPITVIGEEERPTAKAI